MKRLNLFIKGNVDVHDSIHSCRIAGEVVWNGINEVLRVEHPGYTARVKHETWTRSDATLETDGTIPASLAERQLPLGSYTLANQYSRALIETKADAIIFSVQSDITADMARHRKEGYLFYPTETAAWTEDDKVWYRNHFDRLPKLSVEQSMANLAAIVAKIREHSEAPILIYNISPVTPGEMIHCYQGFDESYSTRVRKFNLGLIDLSEQSGVSIIDIDTLMARKGADTLKLDLMHLNPPGYRLVTEEVVRVLADLGVLEPETAGA